MLFEKTLRENICFICHWELTRECNLQCSHCYLDACDPQQRCSREDAIRVMENLQDLGCLYLVLTGGEILTHPDFFGIAEHARLRHFALRLMTNGTLIDKHNADRIAALDPVTVEMSIYGADAKTHEHITGIPGSFEHTIIAAQLLRARNTRVVLKSVIMRHNQGAFDDMRRLARELGADFLFDVTLARKESGSCAPRVHQLSREELIDFAGQRITDIHPAPDDASLLCTAGLNNIFIAANLTVYPCIGLRLPLGNARSDDLRVLWEHSRVLGGLRALKETDLTGCVACRERGFCMRCPGEAVMEYNDMCARAPADCAVAEALHTAYTRRGV